MPSIHKRVLSEAGNATVSGGAVKGAKKQRHGTDIEILTRENAELKSRLAEAYAFIEKKNLVHGTCLGLHVKDSKTYLV
jgi:hypothetical protein